MRLYTKQEESRVVEYIRSNCVWGKFELHNGPSGRSWLAGYMRRPLRNCDLCIDSLHRRNWVKVECSILSSDFLTDSSIANLRLPNERGLTTVRRLDSTVEAIWRISGNSWQNPAIILGIICSKKQLIVHYPCRKMETSYFTSHFISNSDSGKQNRRNARCRIIQQEEIWNSEYLILLIILCYYRIPPEDSDALTSSL